MLAYPQRGFSQAVNSRRVLADLRDVIASGLFVHAQSDDACKWCDFGPACGRDAAARAAAKSGDAAQLPYLRLGRHV